MAIELGPLGQQTLLSTALILIGGVVAANSLFTVVRVLLSVFVLPGRSVSRLPQLAIPLLTPATATFFWTSWDMGCHHWRE